MINSLEIRNFKSIKEKHFELRNLNLLLGLNGMGKSSFIQMLLLIQQASDLRAYGKLPLHGYQTAIGDSKDALYQYANGKPLGFTIKLNGLSPLSIDFEYLIEADYFEIPRSKETQERWSAPEDFIRHPFFWRPLQYLTAVRQAPQTINPRHYSRVVIDKILGPEGQYTAHFIETYGDKPISFENMRHPSSFGYDEVTGEELINDSLLNQINLWMGEISPGVIVKTTTVSSEEVKLEYSYLQPNLGTTNRFKPTNVGFGITYALPVVTALLAAQPGQLIIIENPESHVHPKGQAMLGRLIALAAMNDVQLIIETHSDHILNGIRVAIKEGLATPDKAIVFYFSKYVGPREQHSVITDVLIDRNGSLSDYPLDMLDEWGNQLAKLI
jgi:predicted ATPase